LFRESESPHPCRNPFSSCDIGRLELLSCSLSPVPSSEPRLLSSLVGLPNNFFHMTATLPRRCILLEAHGHDLYPSSPSAPRTFTRSHSLPSIASSKPLFFLRGFAVSQRLVPPFFFPLLDFKSTFAFLPCSFFVQSS